MGDRLVVFHLSVSLLGRAHKNVYSGCCQFIFIARIDRRSSDLRTTAYELQQCVDNPEVRRWRFVDSGLVVVAAAYLDIYCLFKLRLKTYIYRPENMKTGSSLQSL